MEHPIKLYLQNLLLIISSLFELRVDFLFDFQANLNSAIEIPMARGYHQGIRVTIYDIEILTFYQLFRVHKEFTSEFSYEGGHPPGIKT